MNCYLSRNYKGLSSAGNKAKTDIEQIMEGMSFKNVGLKQTTYRNEVLAFLFTLVGVLKSPFCLRKGDNLVLQYPLKKYFTFVCNMAHLRGAKVIVLIHDLGSFRRKALTVEQEIKRLNHADYVIAHNEKMKKWLEDNGCKAKLGVLEIFDYLSETQATPKPDVEKPYSVLYAGALNLRKNTFLYEVGEFIHSFSFNLYGNGFEIDKAKGKEHFKYMGFVKSDDLIATAQGDFGLVWDGFSVSACTGNFGEYLQYNNPHKTSLYIRCELPVIIWSKAALADFVRKNGIGICIDSLEELEGILSSLSKEQYMEMKKKTAQIGLLISEGHFAQKALQEAIESLK
jgi:hypothetical protein